MEECRLKARQRERSYQSAFGTDSGDLLTRESRQWRKRQLPASVACFPTPVCLHCSATCLPTFPCGGTVNPSWPLRWSACPTCICMNWGTCGRSSSTWPWGLLWPCRSDWGSRWVKPQTTTSDRTSKCSKTTPILSGIVGILFRRHCGDSVSSSVTTRRSHRPQPGPGGISARIGLFLEVFLFRLLSVNLQSVVQSSVFVCFFFLFCFGVFSALAGSAF